MPVSYRLPAQTIDQIKALQLDLDQSATDVVIIAIRELWDREIGPASERDVYAELDELVRRVSALEQAADAAKGE